MTTARRLTIAVLVVLLGITAVPAAAGQLEDDLAGVASRIAEMKRKISAADAEQSELTGRVLATESRLVGLVEDLQRASADLEAVEQEAADRQETLDRIRSELATLANHLAITRTDLDETEAATREWAREMYMTAGGAPSVVNVMFTARQFTDVALGLEYAGRVAEKNEQAVHHLVALELQEERQVTAVAAQEIEMESELVALGATRQQLADLESQIATRTEDVQGELAAQQALLDQLEAEEDFFENELTVLEAEQESLVELLAQQQSRGGTGPDDMIRPVPGAISSGFGYRMHPILGYRRLHMGVDMNAGYGDAIVAAADGRVIYSGWRGGYGNAVIIDHGGGVATLYAHQSSIAVGYGDVVNGGDVIGYIGSTGLSTGPHLHFEVRENGTPVDPAGYL
jgi:murein DD-endopeptidase MepM/ murein hydrolase activator NlpD